MPWLQSPAAWPGACPPGSRASCPTSMRCGLAASAACLYRRSSLCLVCLLAGAASRHAPACWLVLQACMLSTCLELVPLACTGFAPPVTCRPLAADVLPRAAAAPRPARRPRVPPEVRQGLGQVLRHRQVSRGRGVGRGSRTGSGDGGPRREFAVRATPAAPGVFGPGCGSSARVAACASLHVWRGVVLPGTASQSEAQCVPAQPTPPVAHPHPPAGTACSPSSTEPAAEAARRALLLSPSRLPGCPALVCVLLPICYR